MDRLGELWHSPSKPDDDKSGERIMQARAQHETTEYPLASHAQVPSTASPERIGTGRDGSQTFLLTIANYLPGEWHAVVCEPRQVIGRSPDADIRIPAKFRWVSRRHAEIWTDKHGANLRDLHSTGGTQVNDVFVAPGKVIRLQVGDRISLAGLLLILADRLDVPLNGSASFLQALDELDEDATGYGLEDQTKNLRTRLGALTPSEREILLWMCRGVLSDEAIGRLIHRSPNTVRTHVGNLLRKLELHSRADLLGFLLRRG
jgi:DNA-binding CsgD family transcriptional regulator